MAAIFNNNYDVSCVLVIRGDRSFRTGFHSVIRVASIYRHSKYLGEPLRNPFVITNVAVGKLIDRIGIGGCAIIN